MYSIFDIPPTTLWTIIRTFYKATAKLLRIIYNRTFEIGINGWSLLFLWVSRAPVFEILEFPFSKVKEINLHLRVERYIDMLGFFENLGTCCRRLNSETGLRSLQIDFASSERFIPAGGYRCLYERLHPEVSPQRLCISPHHLCISLQYLALLCNVDEAKIILPDDFRDEAELQGRVRGCERAMMTRKEQVVQGKILKEDTKFGSHADLLDEAGFGPEFWQEQIFADQWDELLVDIIPLYLPLPGCTVPRDNTEDALLATRG